MSLMKYDAPSFLESFMPWFDMERPFAGFGNTVAMPRMDIETRDDAYLVTAELPGVDKDDIRVEVDQGVLTIEAETRREKTDEKDGRVIRRERHSGRYLRRLSLDTDIAEADIDASFKDGVLSLTIPRVQKDTGAQRIPVH